MKAPPPFFGGVTENFCAEQLDVSPAMQAINRPALIVGIFNAGDDPDRTLQGSERTTNHKPLKSLVIPTGIEPVTYRLGICRSILLSYGTTRPDT